MDLNPGQIRLAIIAIYMLSLMLLGYVASRAFQGTKKDYLLASHSIGPFLLLMSLFGTTMTAFALVGSTGEAFERGIGVYGMMASSSGIIHSLCFFVIGVKVWKFGRQYGYSTQIQFFRERLESDLIGVLLFPILIGLVILYLVLGLMAGGTVIQAMTGDAVNGAFPAWFPALDARGAPTPMHGGIPPYIGGAVICFVVLTYVYFGGMRGTAWANAFQTILFMSFGIVAFIAIANRLGQTDNLLTNLQTVSSKVDAQFTTRAGMSQSEFFTYLLIPLSVGMFPHLFQHWLTAKSAASFKLSVICHPIFIMIVWVPCILIGIWAHTMNLPPSITENANRILPFLVKSQLSPVLAGLVTAGILAAIMSSLDSQFLCVGSMFTNDIVVHYGGKDRISDKTQVTIARGFVLLVVGLTYWLSLQNNPSIFSMGVWSFSGFAALFPLCIAALYWKRLTASGAVSSILAAMVSWLYFYRDSDWGKDADYLINLTFIGGLEVLPVVPIFACSTLAMVVTSLITHPPSKSTLQKFFD